MSDLLSWGPFRPCLAAGGLLVMLLGGCGDGPGPGAAEATPIVDIDTIDQPDDADAYLGLTRAEAEARARADGRVLRILRDDAQRFGATDDYRQGRLNLELDDGVVTAAAYG